MRLEVEEDEDEEGVPAASEESAVRTSGLLGGQPQEDQMGTGRQDIAPGDAHSPHQQLQWNPSSSSWGLLFLSSSGSLQVWWLLREKINDS